MLFRSAFNATVVLRSAGTRETKYSAMISKEGANSEVVKLFPIIGLESMDGATELSGDVGEKGC